MNRLPLPLRIVILTADLASARVLKTIIETKPDIEAVEIHSQPDIADSTFRDNGFNSLFIDVFSLGVKTGTKFIEHIRESYPIVPICLYSELTRLAAMPGVDDYWRDRFGHYYKLASNQTPQELDRNAEEILFALADYLQNAITLNKVGNLVKLVQSQPGNIVINYEQRNEIEEIAAAVEKALKAHDDNQRPNPSTIVPGVSTGQIEQLVNDTLKEARQSLQLTTRVNIGVLVAGSLLVLASFVTASITNRWEAVAFGGFGMAGIIAALITNPLKSISASANRVVQIQVAYFQFLSQLRLLSQDSDKITIIEKSQRLEDAMEQTVKVLGEYGK